MSHWHCFVVLFYPFTGIKICYPFYYYGGFIFFINHNCNFLPNLFSLPDTEEKIVYITRTKHL